VGAIPELNQADGLHPTAAGASMVADTVWKILEPLLSAESR
jgi:acyl-CoA thioesterase-1